MKSKLVVEVSWILGAMLLTLIAGASFFGNTLLNGYSIELQLHDSFIVFTKVEFLIVIFIFLWVCLCLMRMIYRRSNRTEGIVAAISLTLVLISLISYWNENYYSVNDSGYHVINDRTQMERISKFILIHWGLSIVIIGVILNIVTAGFKTMILTRKSE